VPAPGFVHGVVVDEAGRPVPDAEPLLRRLRGAARVALRAGVCAPTGEGCRHPRREPWRRLSAHSLARAVGRSRSDGTFAFEDRFEGMLFARTSATSGSTKPFEVRGVAVEADGRTPLPRASIRVYSDDAAGRSSTPGRPRTRRGSSSAARPARHEAAAGPGSGPSRRCSCARAETITPATPSAHRARAAGVGLAAGVAGGRAHRRPPSPRRGIVMIGPEDRQGGSPGPPTAT
jgi:hypothetical protein